MATQVNNSAVMWLILVLTHIPFIKHFGGPDGDPSEEEDYDEREVVDVFRLEGHVDLEYVAVLVHQLAEKLAEFADHSSIADYIVHHKSGCAQTDIKNK